MNGLRSVTVAVNAVELSWTCVGFKDLLQLMVYPMISITLFNIVGWFQENVMFLE